MMAQRRRVGAVNVSCAARISVSCFAVCVNRKLQLPMRVAEKTEQGVRIIPCAAMGKWREIASSSVELVAALQTRKLSRR
jgi:hypothetical protein